MGAQPVNQPIDHRVDLGGPHPQVHGPAYEWALWSTTLRVVTSDPHALPSARRLVQTELAHVELAVSRDRRDSEVCTLPTGRRVRVSATLTSILAAGLRAAQETGGVVDPTRGRRLEAVDGTGWQAVELDIAARTVLLPRGMRLDLGSTATAWAADRCAGVVADVLEVGALVSLGGAIATAGPAGLGSWEIHLDEGANDGTVVAVPTGLALTTSTAEAPSRWRSATVVAPDCVTADTWATAALASGDDAAQVLGWQCLPARLVGADGSVRVFGGWPEDSEPALPG